MYKNGGQWAARSLYELFKTMCSEEEVNVHIENYSSFNWNPNL